MTRTLIATLLLALVSSIAYAQEQAGYLVRDTELKASPYADAAPLRTLPAQTRLVAIERQGGWYRVRLADNSSGWVKMIALRLGTGATASNGGLLESLRALESGRSASSGVTVATGIRGLDSADVVNANPNYNALKRLDAFSVSRDSANRLAAQAKLRPVTLGYFPVEAEPTPTKQREPVTSPWNNGGALWGN